MEAQDRNSVLTTRRRRIAYWVFLAAVVLFGTLIPGYQYFLKRATVTVSFTADSPGKFKLYWAKGERGFREEDCSGMRFQAGANQLHFEIDKIYPGDRLRIDPYDTEGIVVIHAVRIQGRDWRGVPLESGVFASGMEWRIEGTVASHELVEGGIRIVSNGNDPNLVLERIPASSYVDQSLPVLSFIVLAFLLMPVWWHVARKSVTMDWTFLPLLVICLSYGVVLSIALFTHRSAHPDEEVHLQAAQYYETHWSLPSVLDPEISGTYSTYGYSRLNSPEAVYFLAGKFGVLMNYFHVETPHVRLRIFNILLYTCLILLAFRDRGFRLVLLPVSASPQVWYLYGCFNSDGFALFLCFLAAYHAVAKDGVFRKVAEGEEAHWTGVGGWLQICLIGGFLGLVKQTFWPFTGFFIGYLLVRDFPSRQTIAKAMVFLASAFAFYGVWKVTSEVTNDWKRMELIEEKAAQVASPRHNIQGDFKVMLPSLLLKERGVGLGEMMFDMGWFYRSYISSIGSYGWLNINSSERHYEILLWSYKTFGFVLLLQFLSVPTWRNRMIVAGGLFSIVALLTASILHSWHSDFQPQGRYLAAVLPIVGLLFEVTRRKWMTPLVVASLPLIWLLGIISLLTVAVGRMVAGPW